MAAPLTANEAMDALVAAIDQRARDIFDGDGACLGDAKDLVRALARLLAGQSLRAAFGSPGDWGYETPIGKALAAVFTHGIATPEAYYFWLGDPGRQGVS
jgi:hypothetical protein